MNSAVQLLSITNGADYAIDLIGFSEDEPLFAYVDDVGSQVKILSGLEEAGRVTIRNQPDYRWLSGPRDAVLLRASEACRVGESVAFRSLGIGEFCLEIFYVHPSGSIDLLRQDEFCFK